MIQKCRGSGWVLYPTPTLKSRDSKPTNSPPPLYHHGSRLYARRPLLCLWLHGVSVPCAPSPRERAKCCHASHVWHEYFTHPSFFTVTTFIHADPDVLLDRIMSEEADLRDPSLRMSKVEREETRANIVRLQSVLREAYAFQAKRRASGVSSLIPLPTKHE